MRAVRAMALLACVLGLLAGGTAAALTIEQAASLALGGEAQLTQAVRSEPGTAEHLLPALAAKGLRERNRQLIERSVDTAGQLELPDLRADLLLELARYQFYQGDNRASAQALDRAGEIYRQRGNRLGLARTLIRRSEIALRQSDLQAVERLVTEAQPLFEQSRDLEGRGDVVRQRAYCAYLRGDHQAAELLARAAIGAYEPAGQRLGLAQVRHIQALLAMHRGDYPEARRLYRAAWNDAVAGGESIFIGRELWGLAYVESREANYEQALATLLQAREQFASVRYAGGLGSVAQLEGEIYRLIGDLEQAGHSYRAAYAAFSQANGRMGMAEARYRLGQLEALRQHRDEALQQLRQAYDSFVEIEHPLGQANSGRMIGEVLLAQGRFDEARRYLEQSRRLYERLGDRWGLADTDLASGDLALRTAGRQAAVAVYLRALAQYEAIGDSLSQSAVLTRLAAAAEQAGELQAAARSYRQSITVLESVRRRLGVAELKRSLLENWYESYQQAAAFMLRRGFDDSAFEIVEAMKARQFLDRLAESRVALEKGIDPQLKTERDRVEQQLDRLYEQLAATGTDLERSRTLQDEVTAVRQRLERIRRDIRLKNPLYAAVQYPEPVTLQRLRSEVLRDDELLLEYAIVADTVYLFRISRASVERMQVPITSRELNAAVQALLRYNARPETAGRVYQEARAIAQRLYAALLEPALRGGDAANLLIVPDGVLALLPFELLENPASGRYLIEERVLRYTPSATVLASNRLLRKLPAKPFNFIGFGDPVYDYAGYLAGREAVPYQAQTRTADRYLRSAGSLSRLAGSGREVAEIVALLRQNGLAASMELRLDAREEKAKGERLAGFSHIHFAAHGVLDGQFQAIALSQIPQASDDGFLTLGEIMNSRYDARLVVLSACQTGLGAQEKGEGVSGLMRAVMYAGTPAAVVSLWNVSDEATRSLMVAFYRGLAAGRTPHQALRDAKLRLIAEGDDLLPHPFAWAAFVYYGD